MNDFRPIRMTASSICIAIAVFGVWPECSTVRADESTVDFNRDILPILSGHCLQCHGPDEGHREAGLRLDTFAGATAELESGLAAVVPDDPANSELIRRTESADEFSVMPPPDIDKPLSSEQKRLLREWIAQGGKYQQHWAFVPPQRAPLPEVADVERGRNEIDRFVLSRLERDGWDFSPESPRHTLIRRLSYDLTGLPPTPDEVAAFAQDETEEAYDKVVDRLLASDRFGERMAMFWLDAARYSDTDGFQQDSTRTNWPWRDWVINAFNENMPFDQFTREQFAGDLLPDASPEQRLATCFHRNHMTNGEGGRDPEESRIDYVIDRVNTTGTVWLGLTLGCCQCHSHKYDPVSQSDYYSMAAFFNSIDEDGRAGRAAKPYLEFTSPWTDPSVAEAEQWLKQREADLRDAESHAEAQFPSWLEQQIAVTRSGFQAWHPLDASQLKSASGTILQQADDGTVQASGPDPHHEDYAITAPVELSRITGLKLEAFPHADHTGGGLSRSETGHFILSDIKVRLRRVMNSQLVDVTIAEAKADYAADPKKHSGYGDINHVLDDDPRNGWATFDADPTEPRTAVFRLEEPLWIEVGHELIVELQQRALQGRHNIGRFRLSVTDQVGETPQSFGTSPLEDLAALENPLPDQLPEELRKRLFAQFLAADDRYVAASDALARAKAQDNEFRKAAGKQLVMVLSEREEPRDTHVLLRGVWDAKGEVVERNVPDAVLPWSEGYSPDRLGLANWLTSPENPLTARVMVNHLWGLVFGAGLVRTPQDFGLQGEHPTHPELLDWLAVEFMASGWDVKHMLRLMVHSATYRQSADVTPEMLNDDPENRRLARATRHRLPSWMIRDGMLAESGLLNESLGGPPVRPYQPAGVWADITMGRFHYEPSEGSARYRRTVYAFWRRSAAPAFLFDNAQRRVCEVNTLRTNTPLHALTLLNDLTTLEAARALAFAASTAHPQQDNQFVTLYQRVLSRAPDEEELAVLRKQYETAVSFYGAHPDEAKRYLSQGQLPDGWEEFSPELAALTFSAGLILNLDEAMTRE